MNSCKYLGTIPRYFYYSNSTTVDKYVYGLLSIETCLPVGREEIITFVHLFGGPESLSTETKIYKVFYSIPPWLVPVAQNTYDKDQSRRERRREWLLTSRVHPSFLSHTDDPSRRRGHSLCPHWPPDDLQFIFPSRKRENLFEYRFDFSPPLYFTYWTNFLTDVTRESRWGTAHLTCLNVKILTDKLWTLEIFHSNCYRRCEAIHFRRDSDSRD